MPSYEWEELIEQEIEDGLTMTEPPTLPPFELAWKQAGNQGQWLKRFEENHRTDLPDINTPDSDSDLFEGSGSDLFEDTTESSSGMPDIDLDSDTEIAHRSTRSSIEEIADTDNATWPAVISGSANKPGFDMIHHALNNNNLRGRRQVGTALATAIQFAPAISNFMGQLIKPLIHTIQALNKIH